MRDDKTAVTTEEITERVLDLLNDADVEQGQALAVLFDAMLGVLISIQCPDCREAAANSTREVFPQMIASALRAPSASDHVH